LRQIVIDEKYCKGCYLCISQYDKEVLVVSDNRNIKGYLTPEAQELENCIGCLRCEMICPDMAITVEGFDNEK
jgi:2-oxoglutarate ferredoxin oxidoreductase subunit delta